MKIKNPRTPKDTILRAKSTVHRRGEQHTDPSEKEFISSGSGAPTERQTSHFNMGNGFEETFLHREDTSIRRAAVEGGFIVLSLQLHVAKPSLECYKEWPWVRSGESLGDGRKGPCGQKLEAPG